MPRPPRRIFRTLVVALLVAGAARLAGADDAAGAWFVRVWKMTEGLAGNNVAGAVETDDGFLWIVAGSQLARFDGVTLTPWPLELSPGRPAGRIREFVRTRDGGLAFATFEGAILRVNGGRTTVVTRDLPHSPQRLESLCEEPGGGFLVVYADGSVGRVRDGKFTTLDEDAGLPPGAHCRFTIDRAGRLWFAKGPYVGVARGDRFETLQRFSDNELARVAAARNGGVWIGAGARLLHFDEGGAPAEIARLPLKNIPVRANALYEDAGGAVWFGTYASGLFRFDGSRFESVPISHRQVVSLSEDREGGIWVGTSGGGVNQIQPRAVTIEGAETGLPYEAVQALTEDAPGHLWGLTQAGLIVARQDHTWQPVGGLESRGEVSCLAAEPGGALWFGTRNGLLRCWRDGRLVTWSPADGIAAAGPRLLVVARNGDVWFASTRPRLLQRLRDGRLQAFAVPGSGQIRALAEDSAGDLWVAANGSTLARISADDRVVDESHRIASVPRNIRLLVPAPDGALWLGYDQGGVGRLQADSFGRVTTADGLFNDNIEVMLRDELGWLWLVAGEAIFKVRESELAAVALGRAQRVQPVRYGQEQGVRPIFGELAGALRRHDGKLWIPMATSLAIIDPAQQRAPAAPPPVWITSVRVDDRLVARHGGVMPVGAAAPAEGTILQLAPDHRRIDVDFTAPSFRTPANVQFRYRLEPFDDHWSDAGAQRNVSYSRLAAGDYRLRVRASNSDGVWNDTGATLAFTVAPFFTDTWWFRAIVLVGFTSAVFAVTRYASHRRFRRALRAAEQEAAVERERTRIARDIHDDLGSRLTKIVLLTGLAERTPPASAEAGDHVREISATARQLLKSLDETVWAVNPRNDNLPHLVSYLGQFAVTFLRTAEIACELDLPDDPPPLPISAEVRHHLFLAVKEALTNVVRHAHATRVTLRIALTDSALEIQLADDGRGFDPAAPRSDEEADGLRNMEQRLAQIGGQFRLESRPGAGTRIGLSIPRPTPA